MYTQEDDTVFEQAVLKMRQELAKGKTFAQACEVLHDIEEKLRPLIKDDFLKIVIAEQHFGQGRGIDDVALFLDLPYEIVEASRSRIMREFDEALANPFDNEINTSTH
ncbi:MAG: hypothetical protein H8E41_04125 [Desulfobulbaceae bacterium]|uniref:Uncharacterized protein n=1 Tax=Candidatus Desulfobia pelagia TaxID=2841692 RepID=A0A8J6NE08_9BACT|nr:hypothetical protein [Candidatus Desulfobia pelagia]